MDESATAQAGELEARFADLRRLREQLEGKVLPLATSVDGRRFRYQASLHGLDLEVGGYVVVETDAGGLLGQLTVLDEGTLSGPAVDLSGGAVAGRQDVTIRIAVGAGALLEPARPFHDGLVRRAEPGEVAAWLERIRPQRAALTVGELALADGVPFALDAGGFDRHTFLCGQSGSGKTYALGLLLERLLQETSLQLVILDPNSDYARLASVRAGADPALAERHAAVAGGVEVHRAGADDDTRLRLLLADLDTATQAAVLRLDPVADREEYALLAELIRERSPERIDELGAAGDDSARRLGLRIRNLGVGAWETWSRGTGSTLERLGPGGARCLVVDLGSLPTREEQELVAAAVLGELWRRREERNPVLVVVDEAHNVCPQHPETPLGAIATEHAVRIAGEGRKFGIYLLVATQRPQKLHENVLSQCDNLLLMRMNSVADLATVASTFSFVPPTLLDRATTFRQGEALVAGKLTPGGPTLLRVGGRVSEEGGADVPAAWASA